MTAPPARRLRTAYLLRALKWLSSIVVCLVLSLGIIMGSLGLYRANSGDAHYNLGPKHTLDWRFSCGMQPPQFERSGPDVIVFHGEPLPLLATRVYGPARLQLSTTTSGSDLETAGTRDRDGTVIRHALVAACGGYVRGASLRIYGATAGLILIVLALVVWLGRRRDLLWPILRYGAVCLCVVTVTWAGSLALTYLGSNALLKVKSPADVFKYAITHITPPPVGHKRPVFRIAVNGDSRFSGWNGDKLKANPSTGDVICSRSRSDIAAWLQLRFQVAVLDTSCPGADIDMGIVTSESRDSHQLPTQLGLDESAPNLEDVVVDPGLNSAGWGLLAGVAEFSDANISPVPISVTAALDHMESYLDDLLTDYRALPGRPHIIVMGSYTVFNNNANCPDAAGYTPAEIQLLNEQNDRINERLAKWSSDHGVDFFIPYLRPLCERDTTGMGPEIEGPKAGQYKFHPTPLGELQIADQIAKYIQLRRVPVPIRTSSPPVIGTTTPNLGLLKPNRVQPTR